MYLNNKNQFIYSQVTNDNSRILDIDGHSNAVVILKFFKIHFFSFQGEKLSRSRNHGAYHYWQFPFRHQLFEETMREDNNVVRN